MTVGALATPASPADPPPVGGVAIVIGPQGLYRRAAAAAAERLTAGRVRVTTHEPRTTEDLRAALEALRANPPRVVVTTGSRLTQVVLETIPDVPVVFLVVPNIADAPFLLPGSPHRRRVVGVTSDIDPDEQVRWIRRLTPRCGRLVVLHTTDTRRTAAALAEAGRRGGVEITAVTAERARFAEAIRQTERLEACGVLMVPDAGVYEAGTIRALLLWGLQKHKAVWTFSEKLVESGALGGLYADPREIGRKGAELVEQILADGAIKNPGFYYPAAHVAVNVRTARLIDWRFAPDALAAHVTRFPRGEGARP